MVYKHFLDNNFEYFSSGMVIYHKSHFTNYPVRLAGEIFCRCIEHLNSKEKICLYDPCCGGSYMMTILGFLFNNLIDTIYVSDISDEAIELSHKNLFLLSKKGIDKRKYELNDFVNRFDKESHKNGLKNIDKLLFLIKHEIKTNVFKSNILNKNELENKNFIADIIITDVPYNNLVSWSNNGENQINDLLDNIIPIINNDTIIAISHNKIQKINNTKYKTIEKIQSGHRKIDIIKLK